MAKSFEERYPGYSAEAYKEMARLRCGPMPKAKHAEALKLFSQGHSRGEVCKQLKISNGTLQVTIKYNPEFAAGWKRLAKARPKQISEKLISTLLRGTVEHRVKWAPTMDDYGKPLWLNNRQVFHICSKESIRKPPSDTLIQFFLKATDPTYGAATDAEDNTPAIEDVKAALRKRLKIKGDDDRQNQSA